MDSFSESDGTTGVRCGLIGVAEWETIRSLTEVSAIGAESSLTGRKQDRSFAASNALAISESGQRERIAGFTKHARSVNQSGLD